MELDTLIQKKRQEFYINSKKRASVYKSISNDRNPAPGWKPRGVLVAHLHEHQVKDMNIIVIERSREKLIFLIVFPWSRCGNNSIYFRAQLPKLFEYLSQPVF